MIKKINSLIFCLVIFLMTLNAYSKIKDKIIAKIGNEVVTNFDVVNEINTILAISNERVNKENVQRLQGMAFQSIKKRIIKEVEINKYKVNDFNNKDLQNYINSLKNNLGLNDISLEKHFENYNANYEIFINGTIVNLKWNTLIYSLYNKQLNVDEEIMKSQITEFIDNKKVLEEYNLSEIVLENPSQEEIDKVLNNINQKGFENTAVLFSKSITSVKGGLIGWMSSKSISPSYLNEINKLQEGEFSKPIQRNKNIIIIKLNKKKTTDKQNLDLEKIKKSIINKKKQEMLNIFSNSHYLDLEKKTFMEINE